MGNPNNKSKAFKLLFSVQRSIRYHNRRELFYDRWHTFTSAIGVIFGSGTVMALINGSPKISMATAAIVTVFSLLDLVIGYASKARLHNDLLRRFIHLEKLLQKNPTPSDEILQQLENKRLDIEADELPVLKVLDMLCHNELMRARGYGEEQWAKIGWLQRQFANYFDFNEHKINPHSQ